MDLFSELHARLAAISGMLPDAVSAEDLPLAIARLDDDAVYELAGLAARAGQAIEQVTLVTSGIISVRSSRASGHSGLAQSRGHRTPTALIQQVAGISRQEAARQIRVGGALVEGGLGEAGGLSGRYDPTIPSGGDLDSAAPASLGDAGSDASGGLSDTGASARRVPWHEPLRVALINGTLSAAQHDAIKQGLGEPPACSAPSGAMSSGGRSGSDEDGGADEATLAAWSLAAERLIEDAHDLTVEELGRQARAIRDLLDPEGANARYLKRYEARSFRMWTDDAGLTHGKFIFDDESAAWLRSIIDTALRPRRGGPRFVAADERASADELRKDTRSNEQLAHDLLLDVLKAGALADAASVFGARQAGIRLVQVVNRDDYLQRQLDGDRARGDAPVTRIIDGGDTLPSGIGDKHQCNTGAQRLIVDTSGNPLDVGREHRLFTAKQRVALAVRDGGCRWPACDRPASYCEAHHIDHWEADSGRTDIDRGLLLCSHHHLQLHNNGWKISRDGQGPFLLHPPPGAARSKFRRRSNSEGRALSSDRNEPRLASEPAAHTGTRLAVEPGLQGEAGVVVEPTLQGGAKPESASALHPASNPNSSPGSNPDLTDGAIELRPPLPLSYGWELASTPAKRFREAA